MLYGFLVQINLLNQADFAEIAPILFSYFDFYPHTTEV